MGVWVEETSPDVFKIDTSLFSSLDVNSNPTNHPFGNRWSPAISDH